MSPHIKKTAQGENIMKLAYVSLMGGIFSLSALGSSGNIPENPLTPLPDTNIKPANPMENYTPTPITENQMYRMWDNMVTKLKDKDCFKRAHIWSWDFYDFYNVKSMKVFIHYTNKFNRELDDTAKKSRRGLKKVLDRRTYKMLGYNKTWDYHVAPLVQLTNGEYRVMDKSLILAYDAKYPYTDNEAWDLKKRPATIEEWTEGLVIRGELLWKARKAMLERDMQKEDYGSAKYKKLRAKYVELGMDKHDSIDIKCHKAESIAEVDLNHKNAYCFYTIAPMYYFNEINLRNLAFGRTGQAYNKPVAAETYTEENYLNGRDYVQTRWSYSQLKASRSEFKWGASGDFGDRIKRVKP